MAILKWDVFEGGRSGSQVREGLGDSGSSKPEIGRVRETPVRVGLVAHGRGGEGGAVLVILRDRVSRTTG